MHAGYFRESIARESAAAAFHKQNASSGKGSSESMRAMQKNLDGPSAHVWFLPQSEMDTLSLFLLV
jgi:hypothetical protein